MKKMNEVSTFVFDVIESAKENKVKIILDPNKVDFGDGEVSGLFDSDALELTVNTNKPVSEWLPILVHESCHMDQHAEDAPAWIGLDIKGHDACTLLDMWLSHIIDLNPSQLEDVTNRVLEMELDCEKRSLEKIKRYKLPIDLKEYVKKANAYIYFYRALMRTRKWTNKEKSPYSVESVWTQMPSYFLDNQSKYSATDPLVDLIVENCF